LSTPNTPNTNTPKPKPKPKPNLNPQTGCIKPLCDLLSVSDVRIVTVALEGLENILKMGEALRAQPGGGGQNPYAQLVEDAEGLDKIESLQVGRAAAARGSGVGGGCFFELGCGESLARSAAHPTPNPHPTQPQPTTKPQPKTKNQKPKTKHRHPQEHANQELYEKAVSILENHFDCEEGEDQNLAPQANADAYSFGAAAAAPAAGAGGAFNFGGSGAGGGGGGFDFGGGGGFQGAQ